MWISGKEYRDLLKEKADLLGDKSKMEIESAKACGDWRRLEIELAAMKQKYEPEPRFYTVGTCCKNCGHFATTHIPFGESVPKERLLTCAECGVAISHEISRKPSSPELPPPALSAGYGNVFGSLYGQYHP